MIPTITAAQKLELAESGYFILEDVFTIEEMDKLALAIEGLQRRHNAELEAKRAAGADAAGDISRANEITFTAYLAEQDDTIREFCKRPEFVAITTALVGPDVDLYWNQSVFKAPEGQKEFPWHQDDGYVAVDPSPY